MLPHRCDVEGDRFPGGCSRSFRLTQPPEVSECTGVAWTAPGTTVIPTTTGSIRIDDRDSRLTPSRLS